MAKITVQGFIHAQRDISSNEMTYKFFACDDMSACGYMLVCPHSLTFDVPSDFNPIVQEVAAIEKTLNKMADEYHGNVAQLKERIANLLCIEHTPSVK